ncbi:MAG TPA: hypothetical protein VJ453_03480 [Terriglobales bacterium]|nr:hypothetical protein [Terriglobales bacterium]
MKNEGKDSEMFLAVSIALMVLWLFLYSAFHVSSYVSAVVLSIALSLFSLDWWIHSRVRPRDDRHNPASK